MEDEEVLWEDEVGPRVSMESWMHQFRDYSSRRPPGHPDTIHPNTDTVHTDTVHRDRVRRDKVHKDKVHKESISTYHPHESMEPHVHVHSYR